MIAATEGTSTVALSRSNVTVLVIGTYHMSNPKLDLVKTDIRDTLGPERQKEILELIDRIAQFNPSKIMIEAEPPAETLMNAFRDYLADKHVLGSDEREQIGFRLAKRLGSRLLYPVDHRMDLDFDGMMKSAQKQQKADFLKFMQETPPKIGKLLSDLDSDHTVGEILAAMNSPRGLWFNNSFYLELLDVDNGTEFKGGDVTTAWYQRNLRIFSNIRRLASPGDRVLVLFGAGHAKHLSDFVSQTPGWHLEDPLRYLPKPPKIDWDL